MAKKYLDYDGLLYFWQKIKAAFVADIGFNSSTNYITKTKNGNTSNVVQLPSGVSPSATTPKMDGTAAVGTETAFARGDHVHPTDTSRASAIHAHGYLASDGHLGGSGTSGAAVPIENGDYLPVVQGTDYYLKRSSLYFDGSTTTQALTKKGTWETFSTDGEPNVLEGVQMNGTNLTITNKKVNVPIFTGATTSAAGNVGLVPVPSKLASGDIKPYLCGDGYWHVLPLNDISVNSSTKEISFYRNTTSSSVTISTVPLSSKIGAASGICPLDANSKVASQYLPSYVDDVIEAYPVSGATALSSGWLSETSGGSALTPETGKIYVLMEDSGDYAANTQFRWGGTAYVKLADGGVSSITNAEIDTIVAA